MRNGNTEPNAITWLNSESSANKFIQNIYNELHGRYHKFLRTSPLEAPPKKYLNKELADMEKKLVSEHLKKRQKLANKAPSQRDLGVSGLAKS